MAIFTSIDTKEIFAYDHVLCGSCRQVCLDVCNQMYEYDNDNKTVELLLTDKRSCLTSTGVLGIMYQS